MLIKLIKKLFLTMLMLLFILFLISNLWRQIYSKNEKTILASNKKMSEKKILQICKQYESQDQIHDAITLLENQKPQHQTSIKLRELLGDDNLIVNDFKLGVTMIMNTYMKIEEEIKQRGDEPK